MTNNTKKCYLDSNVLIYWKIGEKKNQKLATDKLLRLRKSNFAIFVSPLCLNEFILATIISARKDDQETAFERARKALGDVLELPLLSIINPPLDFESQKMALGLMEDYSLRPRDAYHLLTMQFNEVDTFATFDSDFAKVFKAKILQRKI